jgi:AraC-like DNA-binding protein
METSILASTGRMLWRYLDARKVDADALFTRCGLNPALIHESRTRYPYHLLCKAYVEASVITLNENIGLEFAQYHNPLDLNALGVTFLSSGSLMEAFARLVRYEAVVNSNLLISITESENRIELISEVTDVPADAARIIEDSRTAVLVDMCRRGLDTSLDPLEIAFTYPEPKNTGEHFGLFRCRVQFSQPVSRISFNSADALRPFTASNRELAINSDRILESMIKDLTRSDIISQVKRVIIENLPSGTPDQDGIAKQVFVSSRTLQRRLADENTNLRALVLEVRRELAEKYIADKTVPLAEISYMLGFSDTSSFSRAFKQWTGHPPVAFRGNLQA